MGSKPNGIVKILDAFDPFRAGGAAGAIRRRFEDIPTQGGLTIALRPIVQNPQIAGLIIRGYSYSDALLTDLPTVPASESESEDFSILKSISPRLPADPALIYDPALNPKFKPDKEPLAGAPNSAPAPFIASQPALRAATNPAFAPLQPPTYGSPTSSEGMQYGNPTARMATQFPMQAGSSSPTFFHRRLASIPEPPASAGSDGAQRFDASGTPTETEPTLDYAFPDANQAGAAMASPQQSWFDGSLPLPPSTDNLAQQPSSTNGFAISNPSFTNGMVQQPHSMDTPVPQTSSTESLTSLPSPPLHNTVMPQPPSTDGQSFQQDHMVDHQALLQPGTPQNAAVSTALPKPNTPLTGDQAIAAALTIEQHQISMEEALPLPPNQEGAAPLLPIQEGASPLYGSSEKPTLENQEQEVNENKFHQAQTESLQQGPMLSAPMTEASAMRSDAGPIPVAVTEENGLTADIAQHPRTAHAEYLAGQVKDDSAQQDVSEASMLGGNSPLAAAGQSVNRPDVRTEDSVQNNGGLSEEPVAVMVHPQQDVLAERNPTADFSSGTENHLIAPEIAKDLTDEQIMGNSRVQVGDRSNAASGQDVQSSVHQLGMERGAFKSTEHQNIGLDGSQRHLSPPQARAVSNGKGINYPTRSSSMIPQAGIHNAGIPQAGGSPSVKIISLAESGALERPTENMAQKGIQGMSGILRKNDAMSLKVQSNPITHHVDDLVQSLQRGTMGMAAPVEAPGNKVQAMSPQQVPNYESYGRGNTNAPAVPSFQAANTGSVTEGGKQPNPLEHRNLMAGPGIHNGNPRLDGICVDNSTHCSCGMVDPMEQAPEECLFVIDEHPGSVMCVRRPCSAKVVCACSPGASLLCKRSLVRSILVPIPGKDQTSDQTSSLSHQPNLIPCKREVFEHGVGVLTPII